MLQKGYSGLLFTLSLLPNEVQTHLLSKSDVLPRCIIKAITGDATCINLRITDKGLVTEVHTHNIKYLRTPTY